MKKNRFEPLKNLYRKAISCLITLAIVLVFYGFWTRHFNGMMDRDFLGKGNIMVLFVYLVVTVLFFRAFNAYKIGHFKSASIILSQVLAAVCTNLILTLQLILMVGKVAMLRGLIGRILEMTAIDILLCLILTFLLNRLYTLLFPPYRMLEVHGDYENNLRGKVGLRTDKYILEESIHVAEPMDRIHAKILEYDALLMNDIPTKSKNELLKFCFAHSVRVYFTPKISDVLVKGAGEVHVFDTPLFLCRNVGLSIETRILKRMFDILVSLIGLILSSPITLITALCIKAEDGGHVFYRQERCTVHERRFFIYKFRSMVENAEQVGGAQLAKENDSRITRVGAFIRKTRIDELPQLLNVLKGDMSLVGPRPERPAFIEENVKSIPEFAYRTKVKAGLTGYAQVYGKYNTGFLDKLKLDLLYIQKQSLWLDLKIMIMTLKVVFTKESTEGLPNVYRKDSK